MEQQQKDQQQAAQVDRERILADCVEARREYNASDFPEQGDTCDQAWDRLEDAERAARAAGFSWEQIEAAYRAAGVGRGQ